MLKPIFAWSAAGPTERDIFDHGHYPEMKKHKVELDPEHYYRHGLSRELRNQLTMPPARTELSQPE